MMKNPGFLKFNKNINILGKSKIICHIRINYSFNNFNEIESY